MSNMLQIGISEVVVLKLKFEKKGTRPTNTYQIQPTQYQTCYNSISEVVVLKFTKKGDTPKKFYM